MKNLKLLLAAFLVSLSTMTFAGEIRNSGETGEFFPRQIQKLISDSNLIIDEDFTAKVYFKVTADMKISIQSVSSPNEEVNEFLEKRLDNRTLRGEGWYAGKIYELPVKVHGTR